MIAPQSFVAGTPASEVGSAKATTLAVVLTGSAGQGVSLCGDVLAEAATLDGYTADVREDHVLQPLTTPVEATCTVLIGDGPNLPVPGGRLLRPDGVIALGSNFPENWLERLKPEGQLLVASPVIGRSTGDRRVVAPLLPTLTRVDVAGPLVRAVALLGVMSRRLPMSLNAWKTAIESHLPARHRVACWDAFLVGRHSGTN